MSYDRLGIPTAQSIIERTESGEPSPRIAADIRRNDDATRRMVSRVSEAYKARILAEAVKKDRTWRNVPVKEPAPPWYCKLRKLSDSRLYQLCTAKVVVNPSGATPMASWGTWDYKITPPYSAFEKAAMKHKSWECIPWDKILRMSDDSTLGYLVEASDNYGIDGYRAETRWFRNPHNYTQLDLDSVSLTTSDNSPLPYGVSSWLAFAQPGEADSARARDERAKACSFGSTASLDIFLQLEKRRLNDMLPDTLNPTRNPAPSMRMDKRRQETDSELGLTLQGNNAKLAAWEDPKWLDAIYLKRLDRERPLEPPVVHATTERGGYIGLNYAQNRDDFFKCRESSLQYGEGIETLHDSV